MNLVILYIIVEKTVQIIYLNVVLESLQDLLIFGQAKPPLAILRMTHDGIRRDCPSLLYSPAFPSLLA